MAAAASAAAAAGAKAAATTTTTTAAAATTTATTAKAGGGGGGGASSGGGGGASSGGGGGIKVTVEFSGGLELLFGKVKQHKVELAATAPRDLKAFLQHVKDTLLKERPELFLQGDTVRPGILVLINDTDWELEGGLSYVLQHNDTVVFISTLHGG